MQTDVVMWAKNGGKMLPTVLKRVDDVVPDEVVGKKILVDDHSTDKTITIAEDFGWTVYKNRKGGVGNGASLALSRVTAKRFISIEQDVVLAKDWFEKIPKHLEGDNVAVAQGWRISNHPVVGKLDEYYMERFKSSLSTIDNTVYKTKIIKALGGFPEHLKYTGVDTYLYKQVRNSGYTWFTDTSIISTHLREGGLQEQIRRYYNYGKASLPLEEDDSSMKSQGKLRRSIVIALFSPFRGFEISIRKRCPKIFYYYPLIRTSHLRGSVHAWLSKTECDHCEDANHRT